MNKLKIVNQPLRIADIDLYELDDEIQNYWDHRVQSAKMRRARDQRRSLREDL